MDAEQFRAYGKQAIDFVADYIENIRDRPVVPAVRPGFLQNLIPDDAPEQGESLENFFEELETLIMPGITHWHSPRFHAYYPAGNSYPSILGEIIDAGLGAIGFSWATSPVLTELEVKMLDWLGKVCGLPEEFLHCSGGPGGGMIQSSASETMLVTLVSAKERKLKEVKKKHPDWDDFSIKSKMVAYTSDQSNSAVEKAGRIGSMTMRLLESDNSCSLRGSTLRAAFEIDIANDLIPTYVCATLGTTGTCAFDRIDEIGIVCQEYGVWLHIDAAYAGSAFVCPELRGVLKGVELADSYNFNPHKWLLVNFECSAFWVKNSKWLVDALYVDRTYLRHHNQGIVASAPDFRNWEIPLGRRFRSLKLWLVMRSYGVEGLRQHIRNHLKLAKEFEAMIKMDNKFEIVHGASMGLVCFKLKGKEELSKKLLARLNSRRNIYLVPAVAKGTYFLRVSVCARTTESVDMVYSYNEISSVAECVIAENLRDYKVLTKFPSKTEVKLQMSELLSSLGHNKDNEEKSSEDIFDDIPTL